MNRTLITILILFWKTIMLLPRSFQIFLSTIIGKVLILSNIKRNKFSKINIDLCFKGYSELERNKIYKKNIMSSARVLFDTGVAWFWSDSKIDKNIPYKINGLKNLKKHQDSGTGILMFFKHSLHLELDARILAMNCEVYGVQRDHNSEIFEQLQKNGRLRSIKGIADRRNTIKFMKWLISGKTVLYAPDQDYGTENSNEINFFNNPASTISAPSKIVKKTKCKTFFVDTIFKQNILNINIEELKLDNSSSISFSKQLNEYIESKIILSPHEYLWQHRRFKSTLGKDNIYK